jgi:hypothetical protein
VKIQPTRATRDDAQSGRRLGPSKDLLNAFAPAAADGVAGMAGGAAVDRRLLAFWATSGVALGSRNAATKPAAS